MVVNQQRRKNHHAHARSVRRCYLVWVDTCWPSTRTVTRSRDWPVCLWELVATSWESYDGRVFLNTTRSSCFMIHLRFCGKDSDSMTLSWRCVVIAMAFFPASISGDISVAAHQKQLPILWRYQILQIFQMALNYNLVSQWTVDECILLHLSVWYLHRKGGWRTNRCQSWKSCCTPLSEAIQDTNLTFTTFFLHMVCWKTCTHVISTQLPQFVLIGKDFRFLQNRRHDCRRANSSGGQSSILHTFNRWTPNPFTSYTIALSDSIGGNINSTRIAVCEILINYFFMCTCLTQSSCH